MPRPKGAKNLKTLEEEQFREKFHMYCYTGGFQQFLDELKVLKGRSYVEMFLKALEFVEPKLSRMDVANAPGEKFQIEYTDDQVEKILTILKNGKGTS